MTSTASSCSLAHLEAEIARLRAREASLARIAVRSVALLRARDNRDGPDGMWLREYDRSVLADLDESDGDDGAAGHWFWVELIQPGSTLPTTVDPRLTESTDPLPRPAVVPFRSAFPLEILEHIVTLAGLRTMATFAQASYGCLQIFAPRMLTNVTITRTARALPWNASARTSGLDGLFTSRDAHSSARLAAPLSLHHLRTLDVFASSFETSGDSRPLPLHISSSRIGLGECSLDLDRLIIRLNYDAISYDPGDSDGWDSDMSGYSDMEHGPFPEVNTWRPAVETLALLNPTELIFQRQDSVPTEDRQYRVSRAAATAIASWTRLALIELVGIDLYITRSDWYPDEEEVLDYDVPMRDRVFLFAPEIVIPPEEVWLQGWTIRWDLSELAKVGPFGRELDKDLAAQLAERDGTLQMGWVKEAVIIVGNEELEAEVAAQIAKVPAHKRGPLRVEVRDVGGDT